MSITLLIIACIIILLIFFLMVLIYKRELNTKKKQIENLTENLDDLNEKLQEKDRRKSFRLKTESEECEFQILKIGDKNINLIKGRKGSGVISDVSFTGLRLESEFDLPVKDVVEIELVFEFNNYPVELKGLLVRKEENINNSNFTYGVKLIETDQKKQNDFNKLVRDKELENRRKKFL